MATSQVLTGLKQKRTALIEQMFADNKTERVTATTSLIRNWEHSGQLLEEVLDRGFKSPQNKSGVINTLVLLGEYDSALLISYAEELNAYFSLIEANGPQTRSNISRLKELMKEK